jgi:hypothetical protein
MIMEVMSVTKALSWLETHAFTNAYILSDSMSMLRKIELAGSVEKTAEDRSWLAAQRKVGISEAVNLVSIFLIFVPGRTGVRGNERADKLAGTVVIFDGRVMDHADVLHALREAERLEDSLRDCESDSMKRLSDEHVRLGVARHEHYAGIKDE